MFKLIKKLLGLATILVLIKLPFFIFYQDETAYRMEKIAEEDFNVVFVGSSRTKFGIIAQHFDSLTGKRTKSYNFGIEAGLPPQTFDWCREIIHQKPSVKYIFVEISGGFNNLSFHEEPWRVFTLNGYFETAKSLPFDQFSKFHDKLITSFFKPNLQSKFHDRNAENLPEKLLLSQNELELSKRRNLRVEQKPETNASPKGYLNEIEDLIALAKSKNVGIFFFVPPRLETEAEAETVAAIFQNMDQNHLIRARHFEESLYTKETSVDNYHLNTAGALIFTSFLAKEFEFK